MKKVTIIWDFDGTILPNAPFDSEQSLLHYRMHQPEKPFGLLKKGYAHAIIYAPHEIQIPTDVSWPLWTADRPHPGEKIQQYEPICNVFSGGKNYSQVCEMIATRKKAMLNKLTT